MQLNSIWKLGNIYGALAAIDQSADMATIYGKLQQAEDIYRQGLVVAEKWKNDYGKGQGEMLAASGLLKGLGTVLYQRNELDRAALHIQLAVKLDELGNVIELMSSYRILAFLKQAEADYICLLPMNRAMEATCVIWDSIDIHQYNISTEPSLQQLHIILHRTCPDKVHAPPELTQWFEILGYRTRGARGFFQIPGITLMKLIMLTWLGHSCTLKGPLKRYLCSGVCWKLPERWDDRVTRSVI